MLDFFSSEEATAAANVIVFGGLLLATLRIGRRMLTQWASRFSKLARQAQRTTGVHDLKKIREYREDRFRAIYDFGKALFDDLLVTATVFVASFAYVGWEASRDLESDLQGPDREIWERIVEDPAYWWDMTHTALAFVLIFGLLMLWATRINFRILRLATHPEEARKDILERYVRNRARR
ncbi:hypothetical protein OZN62_08270 [Aurantiacibacter sp. MUD11]|uniref:hypothetical protein n=1 Tax=Aurantiacibacter sp. MUD11 TaxID=3003265 RepID=UPI0022AA1B2B|nr:hypothetical protein [Aurantiacibacter sp. MUD11]WAT16935.1 hypothetical protein OZN62_08270 [Aurantiacibacter sp. MUD11]